MSVVVSRLTLRTSIAIDYLDCVLRVLIRLRGL